MITRRVSTASALLAVLTACAGGPAPRAVPSPVVGVEGAYRFSAHVYGAGLVDGVIRFDSAGTATLSSGATTCESVPMASDGRLRMHCGGVAIGVALDDDALAPHASLSVRVTETMDRPADPFTCRGDDASRATGQTRCVAYGVERTTRVRWRTVNTLLSRVE